MSGETRVNVGCGSSPTPGWLNIDNSPTLRLAAVAMLLPREQRAFLKAARTSNVIYGTATRLGLPDGSAEVVYSSHMMEHLDPDEADQFLAEALRVLKPGGVLRLAMPDLRRHVDDYLESADAERFMRDTLLGTRRARTPLEWLRHVVTGPRHHLWMYDSASLIARLSRAGFAGCVTLQPGETTIADPGSLDLHERADESLYVEARRP